MRALLLTWIAYTASQTPSQPPPSPPPPSSLPSSPSSPPTSPTIQLTIGYDSCPSTFGWITFFYDSKNWCAFGFTYPKGVNHGGSMVRTCEESVFYEFYLVGVHAVYGNPISQVTIWDPVTYAFWQTMSTYTYTQQGSGFEHIGFSWYFESVDVSMYTQAQFGFAPGENMTLSNLMVQTPTTCSPYPFLAPSPPLLPPTPLLPPPSDLNLAD